MPNSKVKWFINCSKYSNCITHIYLYISFFAAGIDLNIFEKRYNFNSNKIDLKINYFRKRKSNTENKL